MIYVTAGGQVANTVYKSLKDHLGIDAVSWTRTDIVPGPEDLIIAALDHSDVDTLRYWENVARRRRAKLLCVHLHGGEAIIGPEVAVGVVGCVNCWADRYFAGRPHARKFENILGATGVSTQCDPWLTPIAASIIAQLVAAWVILSPWAAPVTKPDHFSRIYLWDLNSMQGRMGNLLPDPSCKICGKMPSDTADAARLNLATREKPCLKDDRVRPSTDLQAGLERFCVGQRNNLVGKLVTAYRHYRAAVAIAEVALFDSDTIELCSGISDRYSSARTVAMLEAIERYSGCSPRAFRPAVLTDHRSLADLAPDPRRFGLYTESDYKTNCDVLTPFRETLEVEFVWGYSFGLKRPVLVPSQMAFYSLQQPGPIFVLDSSSGCALGSSPEEAIFHGLLEMIERDSLMLAWYTGVCRPHLDPMEAHDPEVRYRCRRLNQDGFDVVVLDVTTEFGIPAVWVTARRRELKPPYAVSIGAAHIQPEKALQKSLRELDTILNRLSIDIKDPSLLRRAFDLSGDPQQVSSMLDHSLFYSVPASGNHLDFLFQSSERRSLAELSAVSEQFCSRNLTSELQSVIARIMGSDCDVIAINQTSDAQRELALYAYKVLVPGAVPISWGQHRRRITGLPRLDRAVGIERNQNFTGAEELTSALNSAPHPFL